MAADLLTTIRAEIDARLNELHPVLAEYEQLLSAADALAGERGSAAAPAPPRRAANRTARSKAAGPKAPGPKATRSRTAGSKVAGLDRGPGRAPARERASRGAVGQAILAALEHGSHTVAELVVVTALSASDIRDNLRRLRRKKAIVKTDRDGKTAYALPA